MKIFGITDLHLDINPLGFHETRHASTILVEDHPEDTLLIGGDTAEIVRLRPIPPITGFEQGIKGEVMNDLETICAAYKHVVLICGNHEFYFNDIVGGVNELRQLVAHIPNLKVLDNETVILDNKIRILGTMLWTNLKYGDPIVEMAAARHIADFQYINKWTAKFKPKDMRQLWELAQKFLKQELEKANRGVPTIVMTHFAPMFSHASPPNGVGGPLDYYFADIETEDMIRLYDDKVHTWFHGHTHDRKTTAVGNTVVTTHARGYRHKPFDPLLLLEV